VRLTRAATLEAALVALLTLAGPVALGTACVSESSVRVAQPGQPTSTGNADYDAYYKQVDDLRAEAEKAEKDFEETRAALLKALEMPAEAGPDATVKAASERAQKLRDVGVLVHLELTPEPKLVVARARGAGGGEPQRDVLLLAVEDAAKLSLALVKRMRELDGRASELQNKRRELKAKTKETFGARAGDVERDLNASEQAIKDAADLAAKHAGTASYFALVLASAVETGATAAPARIASGRGRPAGKASRPPRGSAAPATSSAPAPPAPKPKPKSDDFEP
jgi:hypothetical protein